MDDQERMMKMFQATAACATVRRPLPETIDELAMKRDEHRFNQLVQQVDGAGTPPDMQDYMIYLIDLQRLFFNRSLDQITVDSMTDLVVVGLAAGDLSADELQLMTGIAGYILHVLADQRVLQDPDSGEKFFLAVAKRRPDLTQDLPFEKLMGDEPAPDNLFPAMVDDGFFDDQPLMLWDEERTPFFVQPDEAVDFNDFIDQVAAKHSPLQLLAAYRLFRGENYGYQQILGADQPISEELDDVHHTRFRLYLNWARLNTLKPKAVVAELRVYRQFLRFCQDRGLLTGKRYANLMKLGNQAAVIRLRVGDEMYGPVEETEGVAVADRIFTNPNYTMNSASLEAALTEMAYQPSTIYHQPATHSLVLAKALDDHQLDLELKRATKALDGILAGLTSADFEDLPRYRQFVLDLHQTMVQTYHRRLNRWTKESFRAALCDLFAANPWTATRPTILRFLQAYLFYLTDQGELKNLDALFETLYRATDDYLTMSENYLA